MKSVLIIGASRGLGLEFVRQYRRDGWLTLGTCRSPEQDALLTAVGATALRLDVGDENGFANLAKALDSRSIDVCIYNAGAYDPDTPPSVAPTREDFDHVMRTNVFGAMQAIPVVVPSLIRSRGKFVFMSSIMGSIGLMKTPNGTLYRASKAALNSLVKTTSIENAPHGITCFVMHPGWVKTDMGGANAELEPAVSITGMRKVIAAATADSNGRFFDYNGKELAW